MSVSRTFRKCLEPSATTGKNSFVRVQPISIGRPFLATTSRREMNEGRWLPGGSGATKPAIMRVARLFSFDFVVLASLFRHEVLTIAAFSSLQQEAVPPLTTGALGT